MMNSMPKSLTKTSGWKKLTTLMLSVLKMQLQTTRLLTMKVTTWKVKLQLLLTKILLKLSMMSLWQLWVRMTMLMKQMMILKMILKLMMMQVKIWKVMKRITKESLQLSIPITMMEKAIKLVT